MKTNKLCIMRLSKYKSALYRLKSLGFVRIFSDNLADAVEVTSSQVRKDFSIFDISGNKRGGYKIDELIEKINTILGKDELQKVVIIGVGKLGSALMHYPGFEKEGIKIVAAFDIDALKFKHKEKTPVLPLEELPEFVRKNNIKIGIITVPATSAQQVVEIMLSAGIKGVLNFAPIQLRGNDDCQINNVNLEVELENLIYFVNVLIKTKGK
ncbi:MAG: redox-sensing transcriptional repressor Rex [Candidatus Omnitrophica bacterium]|nr:redox-sensing transcriptional repressor Rex [Candidatus Omnitrophota bacterium]MDP2765853.1 redox-sensing transcriptional repressor Rex [Candidatus Methanoperedens sp.]MBU4303959.1 redox-sensing transcriptional repressor Rex [Candidatus Omnitrophota bacterium]MBU4418505.1 redox-sensing transcriptional repressor Rex [Candidatus Omnitrophota bacterium]MBU4467844.1 redox-sensing transcriptional repressor Rex [Candidatus Omnitrophota bacterium]